MGEASPSGLCRRGLAGLDPQELARDCKLGYRAKHLLNLARKLVNEAFPTIEELERLEPDEARKRLLDLPGIGDYSADIIKPHGGSPIDDVSLRRLVITIWVKTSLSLKFQRGIRS